MKVFKLIKALKVIKLILLINVIKLILALKTVKIIIITLQKIKLKKMKYLLKFRKICYFSKIKTKITKKK